MISNTAIVLDAAAGTILGGFIFAAYAALAARAGKPSGAKRFTFGPLMWISLIFGTVVGLFVLWRLNWSY